VIAKRRAELSFGSERAHINLEPAQRGICRDVQLKSAILANDIDSGGGVCGGLIGLSVGPSVAIVMIVVAVRAFAPLGDDGSKGVYDGVGGAFAVNAGIGTQA